jgi:uncharacterized protein YndB with AHSA1/START domain
MSLDVECARLIDATPEEVFDAFTEPEGQEAFYGQDDHDERRQSCPPTSLRLHSQGTSTLAAAPASGHQRHLARRSP